jgi:hypothetical protein
MGERGPKPFAGRLKTPLLFEVSRQHSQYTWALFSSTSKAHCDLDIWLQRLATLHPGYSPGVR